MQIPITNAGYELVLRTLSAATILPENVAPTVPTRLTARTFSTTQINLTWSASTDDVGVTGYKVYRNGVQVGAPTVTRYSDTGLAAATSYIYKVAACDADGNLWAQSSAVTGTTSGNNETSRRIILRLFFMHSVLLGN